MRGEPFVLPGFGGRPPRARELRVVSNVTRDFDGGYSVETADGWIVAGPYAVKDDAKTAKADLVAGRRPMDAG